MKARRLDSVIQKGKQTLSLFMVNAWHKQSNSVPTTSTLDCSKSESRSTKLILVEFWSTVSRLQSIDNVVQIAIFPHQSEPQERLLGTNCSLLLIP
jgi:hypothetical protein